MKRLANIFANSFSSLLRSGSTMIFQTHHSAFSASRRVVAGLVTLFALTAATAMAADRYAVATGNWNSTATWSATSGGASGASVPVAGDNVFIESNFTVTLTDHAACTNLTITGSSSANGTTLLEVASFSLNVSGNFTVTGGSNNSRIAKVTLTTGTLTIGGDLSITAGSTARAVMDLSGGAGTVKLAGAFTFTMSTFTAGTASTFEYNGAGDQTILASLTYHTLATSGGGTKTPNGALANITNLTIGAGTTVPIGATTTNTIPGGGTLTVNGTLDFTNASGSFRTGTSGTSTLTMGATGLIKTIDDQGLGPAAGTTTSLGIQTGGAWDVTSISSNGTIEYARAATSGQTVTDRDYNNLTITGATQVKTWTLAATRTINGNLTINASAPLTLSGTQTVNVAGNWSNSGTFAAGTSTIAFNGTSTVSGSSTTTFNNVTINATKTLTGHATNMNVAGNWTNNGTFTHNGGTVTFTSTATGKTLAGNMIGGNQFNNLTFNGSGGGWTFNNNADVNGNFTITAGSVTAPSVLQVAGNWSNSATFTHNSGTVIFSGTAAQTLSGSTTFHNLTINNTHATDKVDASGSTALTVAALLRVQDGIFKSKSTYTDVQIDADGTLELSGNITVSGNWTNNGTFTHNNFKVTFTGGNAQTLATGGDGAGKRFYDFEVNKSGDTATLAAALGVDRDFIHTAGNFSTSGSSYGVDVDRDMTFAAGTFTANASTITVGRNMSGTAAVFSKGTSTVDFDGAGAMSIPAFSFHNLTVSGDKNNAAITLASGTTSVSGDWNSSGATNFGAFTTTGNRVKFNGSTAQTFTPGVFDFNEVEFANTASTVTLGSNFSSSGTIFLTNGAFDTDNANSYSVGAGNGITISAGTFWARNSTIEIGAGNFNNSATFNAGGSTVDFNGSSAQQIGGSTSPTVFWNLTNSNSAGLLLNSVDATVSNTLDLKGFKLATGANKVSVGPSGTISRTTGYVVGNLEQNLPIDDAAARLYPIGTASAYTPLTIDIDGTGGTAGTLTASTTGSPHAQIATSGLNTAKDINRYWTLTPGTADLGGRTYKLKVDFLAGDVGGANTSNFEFRRWTGSAWSTPAGGNYTRTATSTEYDNFTAFSDFAVGEPVVPVLVMDAIGNQYQNTPFTVTVRTRDDANESLPVSGGTANITLTVAAGSGALGGTLTKQIAEGDSIATFTDITYDTAENDVQIKATAGTDGTNFDGKEVTSNAFNVTIPTTVQSGNWNDPATWTGGVVPPANAPAIVASGHVVTLTQDEQRDAATTVNSGGTLVTASFRMHGTGDFTLSSGGTLWTGHPDGITSDGSAGSIQMSGMISFSSGANYRYNGVGNQVTGTGLPPIVNTLTIANTGTAPDNEVTLTNDVTVTTTLNLTSGVLNDYAKTITVLNSGTPVVKTSGSLSATGTFNYNSEAANINVAALDYFNLGVGRTSHVGAGSTYDLLGHATVGGVLTVGKAGNANRDTFRDMGFALSLANAPDIDGTPDGFGILTLTGELVITGDISLPAGTYGTITIADGGTLTAAGNLTINGDLTIEGPSGVFNGGNFTHTISGSWYNESGLDGYIWSTGNKIILSGNGEIGGETQFYDLQFSGSSVHTLLQNAFVGIAGTFTGSSGSNKGFDTQTNKPNTVAYNGSGTQTAGTTYSNLTIGNGTDVVTVNLSSATIVTDNLHIMANATLDVTTSNWPLNVGGNWTNDGAFNPRAGTVTFDGIGNTQIVTTGGTGANKRFNRLDISNVGGTVELAGNVETIQDFRLLNGTFTTSTSDYGMIVGRDAVLQLGTLTLNSSSVSVGRHWANDGADVNAGGSTVTLVGGITQNVTTFEKPFFNFVVNKTGGTATLQDPLFVQGDFTLTAGTFETGSSRPVEIAGSLTLSGGTFTANNSVITVTGDWNNNASVFVPGGSTVTFNGGGTFGGTSSALTFNNLTISGAAANATISFTVNGVLTLNQDLTMNGTTLTMGGSATTSNPMAGGQYDVIGRVRRANGTMSPGPAYSFGNQYTTIIFSGTVPSHDIVVDLAVGTAPTLPGDPAIKAVKRTYEITDGAGNHPIIAGATLQLHYWDDPGDLNGADEGNLTLWREDGVDGYNNKGFTSRNTTNNFVSLGNVQLFRTSGEAAVQSALASVAGKWTLGDPVAAPVTRTWKGFASTSWTSPSNWINGVPSSASDIIIIDKDASNNPAILPASATIQAASVTIVNGAELRGNTGAVLQVSGDFQIQSGGTYNDNNTATSVTVGGNWTNDGGTYTPGTGTVTFNGTSDQQINGTSATQTFNNVTVNKASGTLSAAADVTTLNIGGTLTLTAGEFAAGTATMINMTGGNWVNNGGTFTPGTGTVNFTNTAANQEIGGSATAQTFNNINMNKTGRQLSVTGSTTSLTLTGTLTLTAGTFVAGTANAINVAGDWTNLGTSVFMAGVTGTVTFNGAAQTLRSGNYSFNNLVHNGTGTLLVDNTGNNISIAGTFTNSGGDFDANGRNVTVGGLATVSADEYIAGTGTQTFNGGLTLSGTGSFTASSGPVDVNGALTLGGTGTFTAPAAGTSFTVSGNWVNNLNDGVDPDPTKFVHSGGTVTFDGTTTISGTTENFFHGITITGTLTAPAANMNVAGNWSNLNTFVHNNGTVTFNGSGTQTLRSGGSNFNNVAHTSNSTVQLVVTDFQALGTFSVLDAAGIFDLNGRNFAVNGIVTNNGTIRLQGGENVALTLGNDTDSGTWLYVGANPGVVDVFTLKEFGVEDYFNLTIDAPDGTNDTFTSFEGKVVNGAFNIISGRYNANGNTTSVNGLTSVTGASGVYLASTATQTLNGGLTVSAGVFTGSTGTVDVNGNVTISGSGTLTAPSTSMFVSGNWSNANTSTFTHSNGTVTFDGTALQTLNSGDDPFRNIVVTNETEVRLVTSGLTVANNLTLSEGTFNLNGQDLSVGGVITNPGVVQLFGSEDVFLANGNDVSQGDWLYVGDGDGQGTPDLMIHDFGATDYYRLVIQAADGVDDVFQATGSIVVANDFIIHAGTYDAHDFTTQVAGLTELTGGGAAYLAQGGTQTFDGGLWVLAGTFTGAAGTVDVNGDVTISGSGTLTAPSTSMTVSGNWSNANTSAFVHGNGTVTFDGSGLQMLISGGDSFNNLIHSTTSTLRLVDYDLTTEGNFTNSNGTFEANGRAVTVGGLALVSGGEYDASTGIQTFNGGLTVSNSGVFTGTQATVLVSGNVTVSDAATLVAPSANNFFVTGNWTVGENATFTHSSGRVTLTGTAGVQVLDAGGDPFYELFHNNSSSVQLASDVEVEAKLQNADGIFDANDHKVTVGTEAIISAGTYYTRNGENTFNGNGLNINGGTVIGASGVVNSTDVYVGGVGALTAPNASGAFYVSGDWENEGSFTHNGGTVTFISNTSTTAVIEGWLTGPNAFNHVVFNGDGRSWEFENNADVEGNFTITQGTVVAPSSLNVGGDWTNQGIFTHNDGRVTFNGEDNVQHVATGGVGVGKAFYDVTFSNSTSETVILTNHLEAVNDLTVTSGTFSTNVSPSYNVTVGNDVILNGGTFEANASTIIVSGNWVKNSGDFNAGTSVVQMIGTSKEITTTGIPGTLAFQSLLVGGETTGAIDFVVNGVLTLNQNLNMNTTTLTMGTNATTVNPQPGAQYDVIGRVRRANGTMSLGQAYSFGNQYTTITFNNGLPGSDIVVDLTTGSAPAGKTGAVLRYYEITDGAGNYPTLPNAGATLQLHYWDGELNGNTESNLTLWREDGTAPTYGYNDKGATSRDLANNSVTLGNVQLFRMVGEQSASAAAVVVPGGKWTLADAHVTHTHIWRGFVSTDWTSPSNWDNGVPHSGVNDIIIIPSGTPNSPVVSDGKVVSGGTMTIESGAVVTVNNNASFTLTGGLTIEGTATMNVGNGNGITIGGNLTVNANGTLSINNENTIGVTGNVVIDGEVVIQSLNNVSVNNWTVSSTGTLALTDNNTLNVNSTVLVDAGANWSYGASNTFNVGGNWTVNQAPAVSGTGNAVVMQGTALQTMAGVVLDYLQRLTVNNEAGVVLANDATVSEALTLTAGELSTGTNTLTLTQAATAARTSGYVAGKLKKNFATGPRTFTFHMGDDGKYVPATLAIANVTVAGAVQVTTTAGEHPAVEASGINSAASVNRYWTLTPSGGITFTTFDLTLGFVASEVDEGAKPAFFVIRRYDGADWFATVNGTRTPLTTQATGLVAMSDFAIGQQVPVSVSLVSGNGQAGNINTQLAQPFVTIVRDKYDIYVPDRNVTFAIVAVPPDAANMSLTAGAVVTDADGLASTLLTLGSKVGTYVVMASADGLTGAPLEGSPVQFVATALAGVASRIVKLSGDNQNGFLNTPLAEPFVVRIVDGSNNPVQGTIVSFAIASVPEGATGQSLSVVSAVSDTGGRASVRLTLGSQFGTYTVTASALGLSGSPILFTANATSIASADLAEVIPTEFQLFQNYPNPFNPSTTIRFGVPEQSNVRIEVYNLLGGRVAELMTGEIRAGTHEVTWFANDVATGTYLLRMTAQSTVSDRKFSSIKRVTLLK